MLIFSARDIRQWLAAPDSSKNYHDARKKHQKDTCAWFLDGEHFHKFQESADFLWIKGKGKQHDKFCELPILNDFTAGSGKTILWYAASLKHVVTEYN